MVEYPRSVGSVFFWTVGPSVNNLFDRGLTDGKILTERIRCIIRYEYVVKKKQDQMQGTDMLFGHHHSLPHIDCSACVQTHNFEIGRKRVRPSWDPKIGVVPCIEPG